MRAPSKFHTSLLEASRTSHVEARKGFECRFLASLQLSTARQRCHPDKPVTSETWRMFLVASPRFSRLPLVNAHEAVRKKREICDEVSSLKLGRREAHHGVVRTYPVDPAALRQSHPAVHEALGTLKLICGMWAQVASVPEAIKMNRFGFERTPCANLPHMTVAVCGRAGHLSQRHPEDAAQILHG